MSYLSLLGQKATWYPRSSIDRSGSIAFDSLGTELSCRFVLARMWGDNNMQVAGETITLKAKCWIAPDNEVKELDKIIHNDRNYLVQQVKELVDGRGQTTGKILYLSDYEN